MYIHIYNLIFIKVHRATVLSTDKKKIQVAVKVQHRALKNEIKSDLATLKLMSNVIKFIFTDFEFLWILPKFEAAM